MKRRLLLCAGALLLATICGSVSLPLAGGPSVPAAATPTGVPLPLPTALPAPPTVALPAGAAPDVVVDYAAPLAAGPIAYGTNGWWTDEDADLWRARYADLAPQIVRLPLVHGLLEPANDDADPGHVRWEGFAFEQPLPWSGRTVTYRLWFEALRDLEPDVTLMLHVPHLAGWLSANGDAGLTSTYPPASLQEYREFVQAALTFLVDDVGYPPGQIILEPVNEPDLPCGQDPAVPCFWEDWTLDDLVAVLQAARAAAHAVDPAIRVVGLSTCCDATLLPRLMRGHGAAKLLDGLTYHHYESGLDQQTAVETGQQLAGWGLPVYVDEYGSPEYWSNGQEGALWHAAAVAQFWSAGIAPVQFAMSEFPGMHPGYNQLGLFHHWERDWELKPAYTVYTGFFRHLGPTVPLSTTARAPLIVAAGRNADGATVLWAVNTGEFDLPQAVFEVRGMPAGSVAVDGRDAWRPGETRPVGTFEIEGRPIVFVCALPAYSVQVLAVRPLGAPSGEGRP